MTQTTLLPPPDNHDKDAFGAVIAHELVATEHRLDELLGQMGQGLAALAHGRKAAGLRARLGQKGLESYGRAIATAITCRAELVASHDALARDGRRAGITWTTLGGPTETTPQQPDIDGPWG